MTLTLAADGHSSQLGLTTKRLTCWVGSRVNTITSDENKYLRNNVCELRE